MPAEPAENLSRWRTALHEAGHAVAAEILGRPVRFASIVPLDDDVGRVENYPRRNFGERLEEAGYACAWGAFIDGRTRRAVEVDIMIFLAGGFTEMSAFGLEDHEVGMGPEKLESAVAEAWATKYGGAAADYETMIVGGDYHAAFELADKVSGGNEEGAAYLEWLVRRTENLLRMPGFKARVEAVAHALLERETLAGDEVREAMTMTAVATRNATRDTTCDTAYRGESGRIGANRGSGNRRSPGISPL